MSGFAQTPADSIISTPGTPILTGIRSGILSGFLGGLQMIIPL